MLERHCAVTFGLQGDRSVTFDWTAGRCMPTHDGDTEIIAYAECAPSEALLISLRPMDAQQRGQFVAAGGSGP